MLAAYAMHFTPIVAQANVTWLLDQASADLPHPKRLYIGTSVCWVETTKEPYPLWIGASMNLLEVMPE